VEAKKLAAELTAAGIRVKLDDSDERPGSKFYNWEIKGVPFRLELGMRDIEGGKVAYAKRNDGKKGSFPRAECVTEVKAMLDTIMTEMLESANKRMRDSYVTITSLDHIPGKTIRFGWCGEAECGHTLEQRTELKLLGTPYEHEEFQGKCIVCGKETDKVAYASKAM
jgi:prolyl-tRNA synthetase